MHALRPLRRVVIRCRQIRGVRRIKRGIAEPQRPRHPFDKQLRQRHARHPFQHRAKHVDRQRIIEALPRRRQQRCLCQQPQVLLQRQRRQLHAVLDPQLMINARRRLVQPIVQPGGVAQQMTNLDRRAPAVRQRRSEPRQPVADRVVQAQLALLNQAQRRQRGIGFGDRRQSKLRFSPHRPPRFAIGIAGRPGVANLAPPRHQHYATHDAPFGHRLLIDRRDPFC